MGAGPYRGIGTEAKVRGQHVQDKIRIRWTTANEASYSDESVRELNGNQSMAGGGS